MALEDHSRRQRPTQLRRDGKRSFWRKGSIPAAFEQAGTFEGGGKNGTPRRPDHCIAVVRVSSGGNGLRRDGRVASFSSPSTPFTA